jgi:hypothetical protein
MNTNRLKTLLAVGTAYSLSIIPSLAGAKNEMKWSTAMTKGGDVGSWVQTMIYAIMAIFIMSAIIMGSLAFKQLAADGNWKDFWSKIAGAVGMFVTPIAVYWALEQ